MKNRRQERHCPSREGRRPPSPHRRKRGRDPPRGCVFLFAFPICSFLFPFPICRLLFPFSFGDFWEAGPEDRMPPFGNRMPHGSADDHPLGSDAAAHTQEKNLAPATLPLVLSQMTLATNWTRARLDDEVRITGVCIGSVRQSASLSGVLGMPPL